MKTDILYAVGSVFIYDNAALDLHIIILWNIISGYQWFQGNVAVGPRYIDGCTRSLLRLVF